MAQQFPHSVVGDAWSRSNGDSILSNCQILCQDYHKRTRSYGR